MKKIINTSCLLVSIVFIILGFSMFGELNEYTVQLAINGVGQMITGGLLILSGSLGLLLQVYLFNKNN